MEAKKMKKEIPQKFPQISAAKVAELMVTMTAIDLINEALPGNTYKPVGKAKGSIIQKAKIISVFRYIIKFTKEFSIPVLVNFRHGEAQIIGLFFAEKLNPQLANKLSALNKAGVKVPVFLTGWHNGPTSPYIMFTDLARSCENLGENLNDTTILNICSKNPHNEVNVPIEDIIF